MPCRAGHASGPTKHARLRDTAVWAAISMALLAGCGSTRGSTPPTASRRPRLGGCVKMWNRAKLGEGRVMASANAAHGRRVLVFAFSDGVCGVAFPSTVARGRDAAGVYVSDLRGDYPLGKNPLSGPADEPPPAGPLAAMADGHTNARIAIPGGTIIADRGAAMPILRSTFLDTHSDCEEIPAPASPHNPSPASYRVLATTASCSWTRTLVWGWSAAEGVAPGAIAPRALAPIAGWRCEGTDLTQRLQAYNQVTCTTSTSSVTAEREEPNLASQGT